MNAESKQEMIRLEAERERLRTVYPPEVYSKLTQEPEDVLAYCREVVRFSRRPDVSQMDVHLVAWPPPDLHIQWPQPASKRRSTQRMAEDRMLHPVVTHQGRLGLVLFRNIDDGKFRFGVDLTIETFCDFFREVPRWADELDCSEFFMTEVLKDDILFDRAVCAYGERDALLALRERISDYIYDFGPLYTRRDYQTPRMVRLHRDSVGHYISTHAMPEAERQFTRFWPHQRKVRSEVMEAIANRPYREPEAINTFAGIVRAPFAISRRGEEKHTNPVTLKDEVQHTGSLYVRDEADLVVARLCGVI